MRRQVTNNTNPQKKYDINLCGKDNEKEKKNKKYKILNRFWY